MAGSTMRAQKRDFELPQGSAARRSLGERIKQFVVGKIESGTWAEGHRVPSETELARAFGTARMTVHGALRDLAAEGILIRRPGAGTHVPSPPNSRYRRAPLYSTRSSCISRMIARSNSRIATSLPALRGTT